MIQYVCVPLQWEKKKKKTVQENAQELCFKKGNQINPTNQFNPIQNLRAEAAAAADGCKKKKM